MRSLPLLKALCHVLWLLLPAAVSNAQDTRSAASDDGSRDAPYALLQHFDLQLRLANIYDSNINHNDEHLASYGVVPGLRVRYRNHTTDPTLVVIYVVARHSYTNTERWDRISNLVRATLEPALEGRLRMESTAEVSLRGSSEDRDISNQYYLSHAFEYRVTRANRLLLYGTARLKRFPDAPDDQAFKPHVGLRLDRRLPQGRRWELGVRYETNREPRNPRGNYSRWTFDTEYRIPFLHDSNRLDFDVKYRRKAYQQRFVEIEDEDFLRSDFQWKLGAAWTRTFRYGAEVALGYAFEHRDSNDPEKPFNAHLLTLGVAFSL